MCAWTLHVPLSPFHATALCARSLSLTMPRAMVDLQGHQPTAIMWQFKPQLLWKPCAMWHWLRNLLSRHQFVACMKEHPKQQEIVAGQPLICMCCGTNGLPPHLMWAHPDTGLQAKPVCLQQWRGGASLPQTAHAS